MDIDKIMQLIDKVDASGISSLTVEEGCLKISIEKSKGQAFASEGSASFVTAVGQAPSAMEIAKTMPAMDIKSGEEAAVLAGASAALPSLDKKAAEEGQECSVFITSPIVGVFYSASGPEEEPFVKVGDTVKKGQVVGIVEAMKLMNEIESDVDGVIEEILVENAQSVEYGQYLFKVK